MRNDGFTIKRWHRKSYHPYCYEFNIIVIVIVVVIVIVIIIIIIIIIVNNNNNNDDDDDDDDDNNNNNDNNDNNTAWAVGEPTTLSHPITEYVLSILYYMHIQYVYQLLIPTLESSKP